MLVVLAVLTLAGAYQWRTIEWLLNSSFPDQDSVNGLSALLLELGSALMGASAIAFGLVMFAVQVAVERFPHGLFRKLSTDWRLLGIFFSTFVIAVGVAFLSLAPRVDNVAAPLVVALFSTLFIVVLFGVGYQRALSLVSPSEQIRALIATSAREMAAWDARARRITPLLAADKDDAEPRLGARRGPGRDLPRAKFFRLNKHWVDGPRTAIAHALSLARAYRAQGDYGVSAMALTSIVHIHAAYVRAKGNTFFPDVPLADNRLVTDAFMNETLDQLRQYVDESAAARNEPTLSQAYRTLADLCDLYLSIDYGEQHHIKIHAHIARHYLVDAAMVALRADLPDVLNEVLRRLGAHCGKLLAQARPNEIQSAVGSIADIATFGVKGEAFVPLVNEAVEQLSQLTSALFQVASTEVSYAAGALRKALKRIAQAFLLVPEPRLSSLHSNNLGAYYGVTSSTAFAPRTMELGEALLAAKEDNSTARTIIDHIADWSKDLNLETKEVLLAAINARSTLAFQLIEWVDAFAKCLFALSNAAACSDYKRSELRRAAQGLIAVYTWCPSDPDSLSLVESSHIIEAFTEFALAARAGGDTKLSLQTVEWMLGWGLGAGLHLHGSSTIEEVIIAAVAMAAAASDVEALLTASLRKHIFIEHVRESVIEELEKRLQGRGDAYSLSRISTLLDQQDRVAVSRLLLGAVETLRQAASPPQSGQPV